LACRPHVPVHPVGSPGADTACKSALHRYRPDPALTAPTPLRPFEARIPARGVVLPTVRRISRIRPLRAAQHLRRCPRLATFRPNTSRRQLGSPAVAYPPAPAPQPAPKQGNGFGVTALVLGIIALVLGFIPIINFVAFVLAPLAIIFAIVGLVV